MGINELTKRISAGGGGGGGVTCHRPASHPKESSNTLNRFTLHTPAKKKLRVNEPLGSRKEFIFSFTYPYHWLINLCFIKQKKKRHNNNSHFFQGLE